MVDGSAFLVVGIREYYYHLVDPVCVVSRYVVAAAGDNFVVVSADCVEVGVDSAGNEVVLVASGVVVAGVIAGVVVIGGNSLFLLNVHVV